VGFDLLRSDVETLLEKFLRAAVGADLKIPLKDMQDLPERCRQHIQLANHAGCPWTAWSTPDGPLAAWGHYDLPESKQLDAYLLHVEWWQSPNDHHALWCYCEAKRPTDWVVGRPKVEAGPWRLDAWDGRHPGFRGAHGPVGRP
jgi:hypothetical protein